MTALQPHLAGLPLIAILRGLRPEEALPIGEALVGAGFTLIEVTLNSPEPLESIRLLSDRFGESARVGAGTILDPAAAHAVAEAGGRLAVMPHFDSDVVTAAKAAGLITVPGVATPSQAFAALRHGADALKLFPADALPPAVVKAWRAVLPAQVPLIPVGGIDGHGFAPYLAAGAQAFGIGSTLYKPGRSAAEVGRIAGELREAFEAARATTSIRRAAGF